MCLSGSSLSKSHVKQICRWFFFYLEVKRMTTHKSCCTQPFQWSGLMCFLCSQLQHLVHKPTHAQAWQAWATSQKETTTTKKEKFLLVCIVSTSSFSGCTDQGSDKPYSCVLLCAISKWSRLPPATLHISGRAANVSVTSAAIITWHRHRPLTDVHSSLHLLHIWL